MARVVLEALGLFLLPFALFALVMLALGRRGRDAWTAPRVTGLAAAGAGLVALALIAWGLERDAGRGAYVPDRVEDGRIIRGGAGANAPPGAYRGPGVGSPAAPPPAPSPLDPPAPPAALPRP